MSLHSLSLNQLVTAGVSEVADSGVLVVAAGAAGGARYRWPGSASVWAELIDNRAPDDLDALKRQRTFWHNREATSYKPVTPTIVLVCAEMSYSWRRRPGTLAPLSGFAGPARRLRRRDVLQGIAA
jgi:hypothetical protein